MNLRRQIAHLQQRIGRERNASFVIVNIPGGEPDRAFFVHGTKQDWTGGKEYPPGALVLGGFDPDVLFGRNCRNEPPEGATEA